MATPIDPSNHGIEPTNRQSTKEADMSRNAGDRLECEKCGATLVYEKPCPCPPEMEHSEICCGQQMKKVDQS